MMQSTRTIIESPFAGDVERNIRYARACVRDSLARGEAPFASHLFYTQPGILNDEIPAERWTGILSGLIWAECAQRTAVYTDLGISPGMRKGIEDAMAKGREIVYRQIGNY